MSKSALVVVALTLAATISLSAGTAIVPTTTLTAETANNTSAADTFTGTTNGNAKPGNVSQETIRKLLYANSTAKVYAHLMTWFGTNSHADIGYDSATLEQAHKQITDMMNRGIDGAIIDWYGISNTHIDQASLYIKQDAETRGGNFQFAIMEDQGAVKSCAYQYGCDVTKKLIDDFNYIVNTYATSSAYMRVDGRPVIFTFDVENLPNIDWQKVMASVQGNPKIVLRNDQGFRIWFTSGSYAWVTVNRQNPDDWARAYLDDFYTTSRSYQSELVYAGVWKGFNDNLATWGQNRIMNQNCGQVWLSTINEMNRYFSSKYQATAVQLVTWNDYEEGTEIETGIDNCVSVSGSVNGSTLYWSITGGQENTIDHYTVFISLDGENLMKVTDVPAGTHQLDLGPYGFVPANYSVYVKAVGLPSILNKMSAEIPFSILNIPPVVVLNVNPTSGKAPVTVTASTAGSNDPDGTIVSTSIDFGDGTVVNTISASHTYNTVGTYTVMATVTDNSGASASTSTTVTVTAATDFTITPVTPLSGDTVGQLVHFVATSKSDSPVTTMRIYVDNVSKYTVSSDHIDTTLRLPIGSRYVVLQGWNQQGKVAKTPLNIKVVNLPPTASISVTPSRGFAPLVVNASVFGTDSDGSIVSTLIDFGDGTVVKGKTATHIYNKGGLYTVIATVTDDNGASATAKSSVTVMGSIANLTRPDRPSLDDTKAGITSPFIDQSVSTRLNVSHDPTSSMDSWDRSADSITNAVPAARGLILIQGDASDPIDQESESDQIGK
jgi:PKD repeat protein